MKKFLIFAVMALNSVSGLAYDVMIGGIYYRFKGNEALVTYGTTSYNSYSGTVVIPKSFYYNSQTYTVKRIDDNAFYGCTGLTSVTIPNSVYWIQRNAFYGCSGLTSITIPESVTRISEGAFYGCTALTSVTIPESVTEIGESAFEGTAWYDNQANCLVYAGKVAYKYNGSMTEGTEIVLKEGTIAIASSAFSSCCGLASITIPNSVTRIDDGAFSGCSELTSVTINSNAIVSSARFSKIFGSQVKKYIIGNGVTIIGSNAFSDCSNLTSIIIPNSVTSIENSAFKGCSGLTSVTIPNSVTNIDYYAFSSCSNLTSITIPNSVTSISNHAFSDCSSLTSITIPNSVTSIGQGAFEGCSSLTSIIIPNSVTSIENSAFKGCSGLTSVTIPNSVTNIDYYAFSSCSSLTSVTFSNNVTTIGSYAFAGCSGLISITIPDSVTFIGSSAFSDCVSLTSVTINSNAVISKSYSSTTGFLNIFGSQVKKYLIGNGVTNIGNFAFSGCSGLTSVTFPNSVTTIESSAFSGCSGLTSVIFPNSVTTIESSAFKGCSGLTSAIIPNSVKHIGNSAFEDCSSLISVTINSNAIVSQSYSSSYRFENIFGSQVKEYIIGNYVTSIGNYAFYKCKDLESITIPNSVTSVGQYALDGTAWFDCQPNGLVYAGKVAYKYKGTMSESTEIVLNEGTSEITSFAFKQCGSLTSVTIPSSVSKIGSGAFDGCTGLTTIAVNSNAIVSQSYSSSYRFENIFGSQVKEYIIGDSVTSIGNYAFYNCSGLESITIGNSVTHIGEYAFRNCTSLTSVHIKDMTAWNNISYAGIESQPLYYSHHLFLNDQEITGGYIVPEYLSHIGDYAFCGCNGLTSVTIPESIETIGTSAFQNCPRLKHIYVSSVMPADFESIDAFYCNSDVRDPYDVYNNAMLHVPMGSKEEYAAAYEWRYFTKIKEDLDINGQTFYTTLSVNQSGDGYVKHYVKADEPYTLYIGSEAGMRINTVIFNGKDVTDSLVDGYYTTPNITRPSKIVVSFEQAPDGITHIPTDDNLHVYGSEGSLYVSGLEEPQRMSVYTVDGKLTSTQTIEGDTKLKLSEGIYIVKVGKRTFKVSL